MRAYDKAYLDEIVETQGKLFDEIATSQPEIDVENFINFYMTSKTRESIDQAQAYVCTMNETELREYFDKTENYEYKRADGNLFKGFLPDWIGRFYAYFQWYYNIASKRVVELVPLDFIKSAYYGLHDLDLELAVKKVGEGVSIDESNMFS